MRAVNKLDTFSVCPAQLKQMWNIPLRFHLEVSEESNLGDGGVGI
jgi:hypothetical protein